MSQFEKLKAEFKRCRGTFSYSDLERLLGGFGYVQGKPGKTGGSARKFTHSVTKHMIWLHEPHGGEMTQSMVRRLREELEEKGLL
jgi:hypothetical protein